MTIEDLQECLKPWLQIETWHTSHPRDQKRFHLALNDAFSKYGVAIDGDAFEDAMYSLAKELHPNWDEEHLLSTVQGLAIHAELISSYLYDTN
ncbi:hypothetical protein [Photobacterium sp. TY1-4]|uniref:hypothetical protein n=1 Tax=Photobacterium sp. TY1-4 TaxID=2899122 RepID=UPI0021C1A675|nr:hypothetical protein [Photobacterium sp. TY1-4]UXI02742.1 hypothetical protein NH461_08280 [Photobacterium sp. TY1-4]